MLDAIRKTVVASNALKINKVSEAGLTLKEAFRLATLGGSQGKKKFIYNMHRRPPLFLIQCLYVYKRWLKLTDFLIPE